MRQQAVHGGAQLRDRERFVQKQICAGSLGSAVHRIIRVPGDHQDRNVTSTSVGAQTFDQIDARNSGQHEVANDDVEQTFAIECDQGTFSIVANDHLVRPFAQNCLDQRANRRIVIRYENAPSTLRHALGLSRRDAGRLARNCKFGKVFCMKWFWAAAALLLLVMLGPVVAMLAAVPPAAVVTAFSQQAAQHALRVSLTASCLAVIVASGLGVPAGYALAHAPKTLRGACLAVLALPLAFPPVASGIILLQAVGRHTLVGSALAQHGIVFVDSLWGVALAEFFVAGSFVAIVAAAAFASLNPAYEESARTLGASSGAVFFRIALPLAAPNVLAGMVLAWMRAIGEYGATSILAYHPTSLPVELYVALSAQGVGASLALTYGFVVLAALVVGVQWALRHRVV